MIRKFKPAIIVLIHILFFQVGFGQAPMNMAEYINKKFLNYTSSIPREELYIHTDRTEYISGEDLWFNIYLIDRQTLKPSVESRIAYFELLNFENRPILQKRILLDASFGPGQIELPDTLSSGIYTIRAYTSWMKNFLPFNCFTKDIRIYNAFSTRTFKKSESSGNPGAELSTLNKTSPANSGLTLKVDNLKPDIVDIDVATDEKYRNENSNLFYLFIQTRGNINFLSSEMIIAEHTKILVPKKQFPAGINQITILNSKGRPVCERFIYTPEREMAAITVQLPDSSGTRKKISLGLDFGIVMSLPGSSANLSISVSPVTNNHSGAGINDYLVFGSEFAFDEGNPLKTFKINEIAPEVIDSLLKTVKSNWINWDIILADELPVLKYKAEKNEHFLSGKLLNGDRKTGDSYKYVLLSHPGKIAGFQYAKTDKEGDFTFRIPIDGKVSDLIIQPDVLTQNGSIFIESSFSDNYLKSGLSVDSINRPVPEYISKWSINHQVNKLYAISAVGSPLIRLISIPKNKRFYGKPDDEIKMKDYIALPVMQEVFFELLAGIALKNKKNGYELIVPDPDNFNKPYDSPPRLFIDGVLVKDAAVAAGLEPELVEKIDAVRHRYAVGDYIFNGIVNIITKAGDFSNVPLPDYAIRLPYRTIDPVNTFSSPDYSSADMKKKRIPDFRNTLYWNPSVKPDKDGKAIVEFWTSDFISDYEVNIQGITSGGKTFELKKIIKVKR